jgi:hypothetical protein
VSLVIQHAPGWEQVQIGDITGPLTQWRNLASKEWEPLPEGAVGFPCRHGNNYRRPTTRRTKMQAARAAKQYLLWAKLAVGLSSI